MASIVLSHAFMAASDVFLDGKFVMRSSHFTAFDSLKYVRLSCDVKAQDWTTFRINVRVDMDEDGQCRVLDTNNKEHTLAFYVTRPMSAADAKI